MDVSTAPDWLFEELKLLRRTLTAEKQKTAALQRTLEIQRLELDLAKARLGAQTDAAAL